MKTATYTTEQQQAEIKSMKSNELVKILGTCPTDSDVWQNAMAEMKERKLA